MWKDTIKKFFTQSEFGETISFNEPVNEFSLFEAESMLCIEFPMELKTCLLESNGVQGEYGLGLIWDVDRILDTNLQFRKNIDFTELYMPFDNLLFFADAGNGDQFFFPILGTKNVRDDVFVWNHENDSRSWVAPNLKTYFEWWLSGKLTI